MIQCVSDSNPYDDEPDPVEEAEFWLALHPENDRDATCNLIHVKSIVEMLLAFIEENV